MAYISNRVIHDADAHIMETPDWLDAHVAPEWRERVARFGQQPDAEFSAFINEVRAPYSDPDFRAKDEAEVILRKGHGALGAFAADERVQALDYLGVASQLVFTTAGLRTLSEAELCGDPATTAAVARAHNKAMLAFCSADPRLLPVCYVPFADFGIACELAVEAISQGAAALMIPSACPKGHSPSHIGFEPVWAAAQAAGIPVVFHVGGGTGLNPDYKENGLPPVPDFHGGDDNFTSVSYMSIPEAPMQTLATLIFDGVLERYPQLRFGVIEMGAAWLPGWMRSMDSCAHAFKRNEQRLQDLSLTPSEYVRRQVRVTPYPHEPAGWIIQNSGPDVCMFSSDYPHVEGGRAPLKRFDESLAEAGCSDQEQANFYRWNFEDFMGTALAGLQLKAG